jgi:hypothetical protein
MIITLYPTFGLSVGFDYLPAEGELRPEFLFHLFIFKLSISWQ